MSDGVSPTSGGGSRDDVEPAEHAVGLVAGTEDSTPLQFRVALARGRLPAARRRRRHRPRRCPGVGPVTHRRRGHPGPRPARGRQLRLRRVPDRRRRAAGPGAGDRRDHHHPGRAGVLRAAPAGRRRSAGRPATERDQALYFDQMDRKVPVGLGRDGAPIYLNLDFLDGTRGAHVSISGISGVATKTSFALFLLHSLFRSGVLGTPGGQRQGAGLLRQGRGPAVPRPRQHPARRRPARRLRRARPARRAVRLGRASSPRRPRTTRPAARTSPAAPAGSSAFWWTLAEFCARRAAALRVRRRRGRAQPVHDGRPPGRRPAALGRAAAPARTARCQHRRPTPAAPTTSWSTSSSTGSPTTTPAPQWAGPVTGIGTVNAFIRRLRRRCKPLRALILRGDLPDTRGRQIATANQQVTVVDLHNLPERAQRFVVGVVLAAETARKEAAGPGGLLFTMIDELNKYAPREGNSPDQGGAARHRRARPLARHHPDRRPADRQRGGAADRLQLRDQGRRPARPGRGRPPRVRLPAAVAAHPGDAGQAGHHVRLPAGDPGAAGRRVPVPGLGDPASPSARDRPPPAPPRTGRPASPFDRLPHARRRRRRHRSDPPPPSEPRTAGRSSHEVPAHLRLARRQDPQGPHPAGRAERGAGARSSASPATHEVDAVLVAGDLYDTSAPSAEAQQLVVQHPARLCARPASRSSRSPATTTTRATLDAYRPLMGAAGITLVGSVRPADKGGVVELRRPLDRRARSTSPCCRSCPSATRCGPPS